MPRETFPYESDRRVVRSFLMRDVYSAATITVCPDPDDRDREVSTLRYENRSLFIENAINIGFYDSSDALMGRIPRVRVGVSMLRVFEFIYAELGMPDDAPRREVDRMGLRGGPNGHPSRIHYYTADGHKLAPDEPFVIAGSLAMQAYRAMKQGARTE